METTHPVVPRAAGISMKRQVTARLLLLPAPATLFQITSPVLIPQPRRQSLQQVGRSAGLRWLRSQTRGPIETSIQLTGVLQTAAPQHPDLAPLLVTTTEER